MATLHVLHVFVGADNTGGNPLGVFLDGGDIAPERRQEVAADLGFSETVFVDDAASGRVHIFTPVTELGFAGHPLVGTAWLLEQDGVWVDSLRPPAGRVATWEEDERRWIRGRAAWAPPMTLRRYDSPAAVDALTAPPEDAGFLDAWAWEDEAAGRVRCRVFAPELGIDEDEATGAAAVRLTAALDRPLVIRQGAGSELRSRPGPGATVEVGGRVVLVETRAYG